MRFTVALVGNKSRPTNMSPTADLRAWPARMGAYIKMMLPGTKRDMRASDHSFPIISRQCDSVPSGHAFGARTYV